MNKFNLVLIAGGTLVVVTSLLLVSNNNQPKDNVLPSEPSQRKEAVVPLPQETDIINTFINLIDEGRPSDAVGMMSPEATMDEDNKQAWAVMFNAFESIKVVKLEPSMQSDWTEIIHTYKGTFDVQMKPEAANVMPIPNYGWDNGINIRWVSLEKVGQRWTVQGFSTGP